MASRHTTKKHGLRGRVHTRSRDVARALKYATVEVDYVALQRELCIPAADPSPFDRRRTLGGTR
ncbi:MAG: DUF3073 family protein [Spirochaetes bacterium]|nr:MAG: DUF3073 family protein [Spirochaetota bacterium]